MFVTNLEILVRSPVLRDFAALRSNNGRPCCRYIANDKSRINNAIQRKPVWSLSLFARREHLWLGCAYKSWPTL